MVDRPKAARAVGGANHANPLSILVPCHRVIGADGSLTGYGNGLPEGYGNVRCDMNAANGRDPRQLADAMGIGAP